MRKSLLLVLMGLFCSAAFGQQNYWSSRMGGSGITTDKAVARLAFPKEFKLFDLNVDPLRQQLFSITDKQSGYSTIISLPNADGGVERFEVFEASNFDPALQAKYPQIRAYSGRGITDKYATLKLSISPQGIQTMVFRADKENEFIEPYSQDHTVYAVFKSHRDKGKLPWVCSTVDQQLANSINEKVSQINNPQSNTGEIKTMRLAQSCNGEYSNWFGAFNATQSALVYAAFNATLTRCNGCYEKDLAIHLNLISNFYEDQIIFYDPVTDPYTTMGQWNSQLQNLLNAVVGNPNYDIGHMFGASGGGGNAGCIGCVCVDNIKGSGITSPADGIPMGDNFDIDYVAHEVGHQMGGNHSFTFSNEGTQAQKEVGAGITIMGYAGITNYDPAPHSIDIFHEANITQIQANMAGKTCPITTVMTINHPPVVAPVSNYTIPISTPFVLTGSATDPENDPITYCWEQDNVHGGQTAANSVAYATKPVGPNWLSFPATVSGTRLMPRLSTVQAGLLITPPFPGGDAICNIEALSSISRTLNFRLTVRDNRPYVPGSTIGQTQFTDMVVTVTSTSGPFMVTSPNTNVSWAGGSSQTITWNEAGTTGAPVSCALVKISLSTDGGVTFPTVLAASTPNDGTEVLTIPVGATTTARIKVESVGNIFYDMSNTNFTITAPVSGFTLSAPAPAPAACPAPASMQTTLTASFLGGFINPITLSATGNPAGTTVVFGTNPLTPATPSSTVTLTNTNILSFGSYTITVTGIASGAPNQTQNITYTINTGTGPVMTQQPTSQTLCQGGTVTFTVAATGALTYQWQKSTDGGVNWNNIAGATGVSYTIVNVQPSDAAQYRCAVTGQCNVTNSIAAILTVNVPPSISAHPQDVTLCVGSSNTFSVTASGAGLTYQWQSAPNCAGAFTNIPGANSSTLTVTPASTTSYRCIVTGTCAPTATSNCATFTVVTSVTVTTQPSDATVCEGSSASFTVAGSGTGIIYQWQLSTDGGLNYNNIAGATSATYTIPVTTFAMNNNRYRAQLSNATCPTPGTSNPARLTVNTLPAISSSPSSAVVCVGGSNTFNVSATGTAITYQWQLSVGGGPFNNIAGANASSYTVSGATIGMDGNRYQAVVSGTCAPPATSGIATLTVIAPVVISGVGQPVTSVICSGSNTSFTVTGTSTQTILYQWQVNTGSGFVNVVNGAVPGITGATYAGATTSTLTITGATTGMNNYIYRVQLSNATCTVPTISAQAVLTVRQLPTVTLTASQASLLPGQSSLLTAVPSASTGGVLTTTWLFNGVAPIPPITGNTYSANIEHVGTYQVLIQETFTGPALVCSNQSAIVTITATKSPKLFIFPSPNDGRFTVSYYNDGGTSTKRTIVIFDSKGGEVYNGQFNITGAYTLIAIDLQRANTGIYYVVVGDVNGKKLATGKVHVR